MDIENYKLKLNKFLRLKFAKYRKVNKNFTIISNNCWSGIVYESYNMEKMSPTVGAFFMADDYIKFISNLKHYLSLKIEFIDYKDSKYYDKNKNITYPIGRLDDIEIFFVHYHSKEEVLEKWKRRIERINYQNIIFKFNDQNNCSLKNVEDFIKLPYKNKLLFSVKKEFIKDKCCHKFPQLRHKKYIMTSNEPFGKNIHFNVTKYINNMEKDDFFDN